LESNFHIEAWVSLNKQMKNWKGWIFSYQDSLTHHCNLLLVIYYYNFFPPTTQLLYKAHICALVGRIHFSPK